MRKLITGFTEYSSTKLVTIGSEVGPAVAGIPRFSGIVPSPAVIAAQVKDLNWKIGARGQGPVMALQVARLALVDSLSTMAKNLMTTPGATATELAETRFPMRKERERTTAAPPMPADLRLRHGQVAGQVIGRCEPLGRNIRMFEIQWTFDPNGDAWSDGEPTTHSRGFKLEGLPRGRDIWVRVRARNIVGAGPWSDPATIMVI